MTVGPEKPSLRSISTMASCRGLPRHLSDSPMCMRIRVRSPSNFWCVMGKPRQTQREISRCARNDGTAVAEAKNGWRGECRRRSRAGRRLRLPLHSVSPAFAEGQFNRLIHGGKGRLDGLAVSHSEARGLEIPAFPSAFRCDSPVPREEGRKGKEKFECSGGKHSS